MNVLKNNQLTDFIGYFIIISIQIYPIQITKYIYEIRIITVLFNHSYYNMTAKIKTKRCIFSAMLKYTDPHTMLKILVNMNR